MTDDEQQRREAGLDAVGLTPTSRHDRSDGDEDVDLDALRAALRTAAGRAPAESRTAVRRPLRMSARERQRSQREALRRRARRRRRSVLVAVTVLVLIAGAVTVGLLWWKDSQVEEILDYAGSGDTQVIVQVRTGDGVDSVAAALADAQVVASTVAFVDATATDADIAALQPGYYRLRQHSSAAAAADQLVDTTNRVGRVRLIPGRQLADVRANSSSGSSTVPGYLTEIAEASCVPLNGETRCVTPDALREAARTASATDLGVVDWAVRSVAEAPAPDKRLEGLILPGDYDVPPGADAVAVLKAVVTASTARWNAGNLISDAEARGITPYQAVVIASVVEREGIKADMPQVAEVIYNRIRKKMKWQMDSTVNYALDRAQIATSAGDRANRSPYNTYVHTGMPPTPISSPGEDAIDATIDPSPGDWLFFVKVDKSGRSCFSVTEAQHRACIDKARAAGVFD